MKTIMSRKSVREYTDESISKSDKEMILNAAISGPTAGNQQLYTIIDVTDQNIKNQLAISCDDQPFIAKAPLVLVFCADCQKWYDGFLGENCNPTPPEKADLILAINDTIIASQNAVIAAESLGLGSCYIGDIMEQREKHIELFCLPPYVFPATMLLIGHPTEKQKNRVSQDKVSKDFIVRENKYKPYTKEEQFSMFAKTGKEDYNRYMKAFCKRKHNSDFAEEMRRSVDLYLNEFSKK